MASNGESNNLGTGRFPYGMSGSMWQAQYPMVPVSSTALYPVQPSFSYPPQRGIFYPHQRATFYPPQSSVIYPPLCEYPVMAFQRTPPQRKRGTRNQKQWRAGPGDTFCKFCKSNNETTQVYNSHNLQEKGVVTCPVLRKHICTICGATGDEAHTKKYCPDNKLVMSCIDQNKDDNKNELDKKQEGRNIRHAVLRNAVGGYCISKF